LKILLLNYEYPPIGGGAGNATYNYAREFVKLGHNIVVLTSAYEKLYEYSNENGVHLYRVPALRRYQDRSNPFQMLAYNISSIIFCKRIIKQYKIDKTIAFMSIPSGITALSIKKLYKIPYIVSLRGGDVPGFVPEIDFFHNLISPLRRKVLEKASQIIAVSDGLAKLSEQTDHIKVTTIHTGVNTDYFKPMPTIKETKEITFIFSGRFARQKNLFYIINQFSLLVKECKAVKLILIGDGPDKEKMQTLINENNMSDIIIIKHWMSKDELLIEYQNADCFINASFIEGFSNSNIEAMSCGLAILASDVTGNNDLIQHEENGLLFSLDEENSLYHIMKKIVLDHDLLKTLKQKSRETVCQEYTWQMSAKKYLELIEK